MKKLAIFMALAAAMSLSGCAATNDLVELADPATQYNTCEQCEARAALKARGTALEAVTGIVAATADVALVPLAIFRHLAGDVGKAYEHTTAARDERCAQLCPKPPSTAPPTETPLE